MPHIFGHCFVLAAWGHYCSLLPFAVAITFQLLHFSLLCDSVHEQGGM